MKSFNILIISIFLINTFSVISQTTFSKTFDFYNDREKGEYLLLKDKKYYIGAHFLDRNLGHRTERSYLVEIDSSLNVNRLITLKKRCEITGVMTHDDTIYVLGMDWSQLPYRWNVFKFGKGLDSLEMLTYNNFIEDITFPASIQVKEDYYFIGSTSHHGTIFVVKSDKKGNKIKEEKFSEYIYRPQNFHLFRDFKQTSDGHLVFAEWHRIDSTSNHQIGIIKFDDNMNVLWAKNLIELGHIEGGVTLPHLTLTDDDGMVITTGMEMRDSIRKNPDKYKGWNRYGILFQKLDSAGNIVWESISHNKAISGNFLGLGHSEYVRSLITARNGDIIAAGWNNHSYYEPGVKGWLCRYSSDGKMKWKHYYVDPVYSYYAKLYDVKEAENGDIVCTGQIDGDKLNHYDTKTWLLRVDTNGCVTPGCECVPDSNTRVWATTEAEKILVNTPNVWYQSNLSDSGIASSRYKLGYYLIKNCYAFGLLKSDEETGEKWDTTGILFRQVGDKVWTYKDKGEADPLEYEYSLLYDFSLEVGDTFRSKIFGDNEFYLLVEEVDSVVLEDGSSRKRLKLSCSNETDTINFSHYGLRTWIQGVGDTRGLIAVSTNCLKDQNTSLLCFKQKGNQVWNNYSGYGCWIVGIDDIAKKSFNVYPNPVENILTVQFQNWHNIIDWRIYDIEGREIKSGRNINTDTFIITGLNALGSGVYFLHVMDDEHNVGVQKIILE